jgi:hypothetical protein
MTEIGVRIKAIADVSDAASKFGALSNSIAGSRQLFNAPDPQLSLRNQFLRDSGLGGYSKANEINQRFGTILNSIGSSDKALNKSIKSGDLEGTKNYAELNTNLRNQFLKDTQLAGYKDVKLDSKPLENAIVNLTAIINQMIADGKSKEAKEYGNILKSFQDQLGAENEDERRTRLAQDQQTRFLRGINRFFGIGNNAIGQAGAGNAAGAVLGAAGGATGLLETINGLPAPIKAAGGIATAAVTIGTIANKLSEQWEKVMQPSMGLAASMGILGSDSEKNSAAFKEVFSRATNSDVLHGYKNEEGLQLANELSKMGVRSGNVFKAESNVLGYQRATDADRGVLSRAVGYADRYRAGENVLGYAYGGLKESGMQTGQYQEYLNATLRIFEEGLSKGVIKGFAEITRTQNMLAQIGESWKGEAGMERRQNISSAIEGSYHLQSDYDVIMYRAAQAMTGSNNYETIAMALDKGIDAKGEGEGGKSILSHYRDVLENTTGLGQSGIMTTMKSFNLNYTAAKELLDAIGKKDFGRAKDIIKDPANKDVKTTEDKLLSVQERISADLSLIGSTATELKTGALSGLSKITNLMAGNRTFATASVRTMDAMTEAGLNWDRAYKIDKAFQKAYTASNQPDADGNGEGDFGQRARRIYEGVDSLSGADRFWLASHPKNDVYKYLEDTFKKETDFTEENTNIALNRMSGTSLMTARRGKSETAQRREFFGETAASIEGDSKSADTLRELFTRDYDAIPVQALENIFKARDSNSFGKDKIMATSIGGLSEADDLLRAIREVANSFPDLATALNKATAAMERSSEVNVVVEGG